MIRDNGIDGVIVRLGYYAYDEDKQLAYNVKELNRLGVPYGVYLYTYAENESDAELEAKHTIKLMENIIFNQVTQFIMMLKTGNM